MSPIPIGGGGGGGSGPGFLAVNPTSFAFGQVAVGSVGNITVTVTNNGGLSFNVVSVGVGGAPYTLIGLPAFPKTLSPGSSFQFTLRFTPVAAGTFNDTLTITTSGGVDNSPFSGAITGQGIVPATGVLTSTPSSGAFPPTVITKTSTIPLTLKNIGTADLTLTAIVLGVGLPFGFFGAPGLPLVMHPGDTTIVNVTYSPTVLSGQLLQTDTLNFTTTANNLVVTLTGTCVQITPVVIANQNIRAIVFAFSDNVPNVLHKVLDSTNLAGLSTSNSTLSGVILFNGAVWNQPGVEKKLRRVQVFYENVGVGTVTLTITSLRPSIGPDSFDAQTQSINIGTALADLTERSAFFDIQCAGEILLVQLSRPVSGGPVSIIGLLPEFEDGGEKVAGR